MSTEIDAGIIRGEWRDSDAENGSKQQNLLEIHARIQASRISTGKHDLL
jgi:hypothetical protein